MTHLSSSWIKQFVHRQQSYIAVAVAIYLGLWAADRPVSIGPTLVYTLFLSNLVVLIQDHLGFLYVRKRILHSWLLYSPLLLVFAILGVTLVNLIEFPVRRLPEQTLWQFLESGWKFPFMATVIFGVSSQIYRQTRERLESKNRELQETLDQETAERQLQGQELQQAREIQQSLLPKEFPQVPGFEIDGAWEPARAVGGDYFDVIRLSDTKLGICIADVVGKSVSAALLMANVQASVRAFAAQAVPSSELCSRVNSVLCASVTTGKFVTFFFGILDARRGTMRYTNAGHLPPILFLKDGRVKQLENGGAVLGVFPGWKYEDSIVQLNPGDRLVLFTDGLTEAALPDGEEFGEAHLISSVRANAANSTSEVKLQLLNDVKQFCSGQLADDVTLIVVSALPLDSGTAEVANQSCASA